MVSFLVVYGNTQDCQILKFRDHVRKFVLFHSVIDSIHCLDDVVSYLILWPTHCDRH